jgi:hypothetical protein
MTDIDVFAAFARYERLYRYEDIALLILAKPSRDALTPNLAGYTLSVRRAG